MPSILLEVGFISNPNDEVKLRQKAFREKVADSIFWGLL
jgi:N-acetylmuramoyl-L-alanine amidase